MKEYIWLIAIVLLVIGAIILIPRRGENNRSSDSNSIPNKKSDERQMRRAFIETSQGRIELELYFDKAPKTVDNFIAKAESGFYNNLFFHRVEDWVVQGGDPKGDGTGGGQMATEINDLPFVTGSVGVARGSDIEISNDSQFFICKSEASWLDNQYTNFGKVVLGMDVVNKITVGDKIISIVVK